MSYMSKFLLVVVIFGGQQLNCYSFGNEAREHDERHDAERGVFHEYHSHYHDHPHFGNREYYDYSRYVEGDCCTVERYHHISGRVSYELECPCNHPGVVRRAIEGAHDIAHGAVDTARDISHTIL